MFSRFTRRILIIIGFNIGLIGLGTVGYWAIEGWNLLDALYMTVITIGSVGYGEVRSLSFVGRIFTILFILVGVGSVAASFTLLVETILSTELRGEIQAIRMQKAIDNLDGHIIICGYGRVGQNATQVLQRDNQRPIVIVDNDPKCVLQLQNDNYMVLEGDATDDDVLRRAGLERAWGLIVAAGSDSVNLFIVVSARALNPKLTIVARSSRAENEEKMIRAGANRVVSPYNIGGMRMANSLMRPHLTEFIEELTIGAGVELWLEEMMVEENSGLLGQTIAELDLRRRTGVTLLAILRSQSVITPSTKTHLQVRDQLILIGTRQQLDKLEQLLAH
ncbi:MAG: potassium channel protein [Chloroflexota bacterium]